jgi:hypothetical protein
MGIMNDQIDIPLGRPICEVCGWEGAPIYSSHELQDPDTWEHHCQGITVAKLIEVLAQ